MAKSTCTDERKELNATNLYTCGDGDQDGEGICIGGMVSIGLMVFLYFVTTLILLYSAYNYLVKLGKWKILIPFTFYLFSLAIVVLRLI